VGSRMLFLMREGKAPEAILKKAAEGSLALPALEGLEILVELAEDSSISGGRYQSTAAQTLARMDEAALAACFAEPELPLHVIEHYLSDEELSPRLLRALCDNRAVSEEHLRAFASHADLPQRAALLSSERVQSSERLMIAAASGRPRAKKKPEPAAPIAEVQEEESFQLADEAEIAAALDDDVLEFLENNADELGSERNDLDLKKEGMESDELFELILRACSYDEYMPDGMDESQRMSLIQQIGSLRIGDKIKLALRGNREVRTLLIRETSRMVALAVIDSPKITDQEIENFSAMTGLQDFVLRAIAGKRRFMKRYNVVRILCFNPKFPLDISLKLAPRLIDADLKRLIKDKNLPETLRKVSFKIWRDRNTRKR